MHVRASAARYCRVIIVIKSLKSRGKKLGSKQKYLNLSDRASRVLENSTASKFLALHSFSSLPNFFSLVFSLEGSFGSPQHKLHTFSPWLSFSLTIDFLLSAVAPCPWLVSWSHRGWACWAVSLKIGQCSRGKHQGKGVRVSPKDVKCRQWRKAYPRDSSEKWCSYVKKVHPDLFKGNYSWGWSWKISQTSWLNLSYQ